MSEQTFIERLGGKDNLHKHLVRFYAKVRKHERLAPIFNEKIDDWDAHIEHIFGFWLTQTGAEHRYQGGLLGKHLPLPLEKQHFVDWLTLWDETCKESFKDEEARKALSERAHMIGARMFMMVDQFQKNQQKV